MSDILEIYQQYNIPPNLQRHMLEVTAVGRFIVDHWRGEQVNKQLITHTLLLHDMGNIIKFQKPFLSDMGKDETYWVKVQHDFKKKYGNDVHHATEEIICEILGEESDVLKLTNQLGFHSIEQTGYLSLEARICDHADMCVSPTGITTFAKRIEDLQQRYQKHDIEKGIVLRKENAKYIQQHVDVDLDSLPEIDFTREIEKLKEYVIE